MSILFLFKRIFSFRIFILSEKVPIEENRVGNNKEKERSGSPIVCDFPFLKITAPGNNFCNLSVSKFIYFLAAGYEVNKT